MQVHPRESSGDIDLDALLNGDTKAFESLVQKESPRLFRMIMRIVGDEDEARSVMQETYLQAYKRLDTFRRESKFSIKERSGVWIIFPLFLKDSPFTFATFPCF